MDEKREEKMEKPPEKEGDGVFEMTASDNCSNDHVMTCFAFNGYTSDEERLGGGEGSGFWRAMRTDEVVAALPWIGFLIAGLGAGSAFTHRRGDPVPRLGA